MKNALKASIPAPLWRLARAAFDSVRRLPELPGAYLHPWRRESIRRLAALKDIHRGERAFIIGNGPSLKRTDLSRLSDELTFGLNRIYLMFPELGFTTTYLCVVNDLVIEQTTADLMALEMPRFIAWRSRRHFASRSPITQSPKRQSSDAKLPTFLYTTYTSPRFATDVRGRVWEGATVTNVALQLAYHMGFEQVILIGVDHSYSAAGKPNTTVTAQGDDPNHFSPHYFGKGFRWQLPDLENSELGYAMARDAYRRAGREVLDATIDGRLTVFPKVDYNSLF
jgi:hypothetical protein